MKKRDLMGAVKKDLSDRMRFLQHSMDSLSDFTSAEFFGYLMSSQNVTVNSGGIVDYLKEEISSMRFVGGYEESCEDTYVVYTFKDSSSVRIGNENVFNRSRLLYAYIRLLTREMAQA